MLYSSCSEQVLSTLKLSVRFLKKNQVCFVLDSRIYSILSLQYYQNPAHHIIYFARCKFQISHL